VLFNSVQYAVFLAVVLAVFWNVPDRARLPVLLVASYVFYGWWDWWLCFLLAFTTVATWVAGRTLARMEDGPARTVVLLYGLAVPLGTLVAFKLAGFFVSDVGEGTGIGLQLIGPGVELLVPVGLSFYTFQAVSYVVDEYRREQKATPSLLDHALYISFFPHLLAGPILRSNRLVPALHRIPEHNTSARTAEGLELLLTGLFKKVVLADTLTASGVGLLTGPGIRDIGDLTTVRGLVGVASGVLGDFFDIAGYIDMARGSAKLLGIDMQPNFIQPLTRSRYFGDFWRRWQITIMGWFRDYVFRPLRGRKPSGLRESAALIATFITVGLWHSGKVTWLIWGVLTASVLITETWVRRRLATRRRLLVKQAKAAGRPPPGAWRPEWFRRAYGLLYVYVVLALTVVWLGAPDAPSALHAYRLLVVPSAGPIDGAALLTLVLGATALVLLDQRERVMYRVEGAWDPPTRARMLGFAVMVVGVVVYAGASSQPFVYFQF
jgi:D-alanyl-lipoteichoic acid acyltransferase DltB (MBOAT superfamily)